MGTFGIPQSDWDRAQREARSILIEQGKSPRSEIHYSNLASKLSSIVKFDPHGTPFFAFLDQISREEDSEAGCMLSVFVVTKATGRPGKGFFDLAHALGRTFIDEDVFWLEERQRAIDYCKRIK